MSRCHCDDFSRTQLLKRAAAVAGNTLPGTSAGVPPAAGRGGPDHPTPAGSGLDRRQFLLRGAGVLVSVYGAS